MQEKKNLLPVAQLVEININIDVHKVRTIDEFQIEQVRALPH